MYSLGFSFIGGIILGLYAKRFPGKRKSTAVTPL
jgi:hypothetical protein